MSSRILMLILIALLALPATALTRPPTASTNARAATDAAPVNAPAQDEAAAKKKKPKFKTVTRTVRQPVTRTFSNPGAVTIPGAGTSGPANPYPAAIEVAGFANGVITDVNLILHDYSHTYPSDVRLLLAPAHLPNLNAIVMGKACGDAAVTNITLTLDDQAVSPLPKDAPCGSGTFQPTNHWRGDNPFPAPAPTPSGNSRLDVFNNANPNGSWQLFVWDDRTGGAIGGAGQFAGGWTLEITAEADVQVQKKIKQKDKKHKKKGKGRR